VAIVTTIRFRMLAVCASLGVISTPGLVYAQSAGGPGQASQGDGQGEPGGDIVVTATKREQNIQDVPLAVSSYSAQQLERSGIRDIRDLQSLAPSLNLGVTQSEAAAVHVRLRNVGTEAVNPGLESSDRKSVV
jgi:outer membrane receptor protein involved in Fe transport